MARNTETHEEFWYLCQMNGRIEHRFNVWGKKGEAIVKGQKCFCGSQKYSNGHKREDVNLTVHRIVGIVVDKWLA